jgi:thiamine biosynthesis lipoprotein
MSKEYHRLGAHAMATEFQILIAGTSETKAQTCAAEALRDLELLEADLSRFRDGSDISRLNHLTPGKSTPIGEAAYDCISLAKEVHSATRGAFDITIGPLLAVWTNPDHTPRQPSESELNRARSAVGIDKVLLNPESREASVTGKDIWLDVGGIGKGYALDQMASILKAKGIDNALLDAGGSTLLAFGKGPAGDGWPVGTGEAGIPAIYLQDQSLSGSGFSERGEHIIDPREGVRVSAGKKNAWALAPFAALADALSTAFLVMNTKEITTFCGQHRDIEAILPA